MAALPLPLRIYFAAANMVAPLAYRRISAQLMAEGASPARLRERKGVATAKRPGGRLVWLHAASLGESLSLLPVMEGLHQAHPDLTCLLTSGTNTSAQVLKDRLPPYSLHQFAPLDSARVLRRFLDHWSPDAAIFVESELWPHMLHQLHVRGTPTALINARLSPGSRHQWGHVPKTFKHLTSPLRLIHCQDDATFFWIQQLSVGRSFHGKNLKSLAVNLPFDPAQKDFLQRRLGTRPVWVAASTHAGEEEIMLNAHAVLRKTNPDALLILVPRHPARADQVEELLRHRQLSFARRSRNEEVEPETEVYLADTIGETGLWYALSSVTCLCGSFTPVGGHNPYEPIRAGSALIHGPHYENFTDDYAKLTQAGAAWEVPDGKALSEALVRLLSRSDSLRTLQDKARAVVEHQTGALSDLCEKLSKALELG